MDLIKVTWKNLDKYVLASKIRLAKIWRAYDLQDDVQRISTPSKAWKAGANKSTDLHVSMNHTDL